MINKKTTNFIFYIQNNDGHIFRIMMDMTDFIKGKGPIKSTQDIITSAKRIRQVIII